ncbi:MAG: DUF359 domain-containing protein [Aigarchaeota archaeon]|nr:DUF359 domain-containing protein [Aigarchaeota archaeon]MCS7126990.1 DUF359 domain-containing protein [Candidatus Calditenuaceae archaeon]MDW8043112.1 DUF359 domain-containing protein [Nitrososphaerota archaeon]
MRSGWSELFRGGARALVLTEAQREILRRPIGDLIPGSPVETREALRGLLGEGTALVVAVGDVVSAEVSAIMPKRVVYVTDDRSRRTPSTRVELQVEEEIRCANPAGSVTRESFEALEAAILRAGRVRVLVEGEEDLLALVAVYLAPTGSLVLYGQPSEGLVVVEVNEERKRFAYLIFSGAVPVREAPPSA